MSRYMFEISDELNYDGQPVASITLGFDHACGYFFQVWVEEQEEPLVDLDTYADGLTNGPFLLELQKIDLPYDYRVVRLNRPGGDVPFGYIKSQVLGDLDF